MKTTAITRHIVISSLLLIALLAVSCSAHAKGRLRVAFVGDPQVDTEQELGYARKSIYSELRSRTDLDLVIILGDLVNDKTQFLEASVATLDSLPCPWICVPGNHDRDMYKASLSNIPGYHKLQRPRDLDSFQGIVGPADTVFTMEGIKFICLNDVLTVDSNDYKGGLTTEQKIRLERELSSSWTGAPTVICTHIPLDECEGLTSLVRKYDNILLVAGHTHRVMRSHDNLVAGASCGSWWRGARDCDGIPYALMMCGAPRGYFVADFSEKAASRGQAWYTLDFKAVGRDDRLSATIIDNTLKINVYGGSREGVVTLKMKGIKGWTEAARTEVIATECAEVIDWNNSHDRAYKKAHREEFIPMLNRPSSHVWTLPLPAGVNPSSVKVRYSDEAMNIKASASVRKSETSVR